MSIDRVEVEVERVHIPYPIPASSIVGGHVVVYGYAIKESSGAAPAELDLYDGTDNRGLLALPIPLTQGAGAVHWFGPQGVHFRNGLYSAVTGALAGSVFVNLEKDNLRFGQ